MVDTLTQYVIPLLMFSMVIFRIFLRIRSHGGPAGVFMRFFILLFAPSLVYAAISDDSDVRLFLLSLIFALALEGWPWLLRNHKRITGNRRFDGDAE